MELPQNVVRKTCDWCGKPQTRVRFQYEQCSGGYCEPDEEEIYGTKLSCYSQHLSAKLEYAYYPEWQEEKNNTNTYDPPMSLEHWTKKKLKLANKPASS